MKTRNKILSSLFVALAPAAVVAALVGFSGTVPHGAELVGACAAAVGLQLVAMSDWRRRSAIGVPLAVSSAPAPTWATLHVHPTGRKMHRRDSLAA